MGVSLSTTLHTSFDDAVERTRAALARQGFGVLTEIDMKATLKAKLGEDMEDYLILGACNPSFAHKAVNIYRPIGVLLPCNVVVRKDTGRTRFGDRRRDGSQIDGRCDPRVRAEPRSPTTVRGMLNEALQEVSGGSSPWRFVTRTTPRNSDGSSGWAA